MLFPPKPWLRCYNKYNNKVVFETKYEPAFRHASSTTDLFLPVYVSPPSINDNVAPEDVVKLDQTLSNGLLCVHVPSRERNALLPIWQPYQQRRLLGMRLHIYIADYLDRFGIQPNMVLQLSLLPRPIILLQSSNTKTIFKETGSISKQASKRTPAMPLPDSQHRPCACTQSRD